MPADQFFSYATLFGFLFTLARVSCVFAFLPLAAFRGAADTPKIFLSLGFALILWPEWKGPVSAEPGIGRIVAGLAGEAAMGFAIGLVLAIVLEVFQVAAQVVSIQAGFGFASTIDPTSGADSTVLLTLAQITAGLLFFATGADRLLVRALADSLRLSPPESFILKRAWADALIHFSSSIFGAGLRLAAPVVALLMLTDVALAVLGRVQSQIQLVTLTLPVKLAASMLLVAATLVFQPGVFGGMMTQGLRLVEGIFRTGALMSDSSQRTEKPTAKRLEKARKDGEFPVAREFVSAMQFFAFVSLAAAYFPDWVRQVRAAMATGLRAAFATSLTPSELAAMLTRLTLVTMQPLAILGLVLMAFTLLLQMGATNLGFSLSNLSPKLERLNPVNRLKELPSNNMAHFLQAAVMMPVMLWMTWSLIKDRLPELMRLPLLPVVTGADAAGMLIRDALKKAAFVLVILGAVMLVRDRSRYNKRLMMSKQEIRDESKENEGNPQLKAKVRRIQRDMRRKNMMKAVPTATAIIVNPTHYAVALKYDQGGMSAPMVVAKGKNYLATRIRQRAIENQVPIIENPPLAQALYKSVDIGQEIPPDLYRAVAEILAYIFKLTNPQGRRT